MIGKRNGIEVALLGMIFSVVAKFGYTVKLGVCMLPDVKPTDPYMRVKSYTCCKVYLLQRALICYYSSYCLSITAHV